MSTNKWMSKMCNDFSKAAAEMKSPSAEIIKLKSPSLNWAIGNSGLSEGKVAVMFGRESSGKSLLSQLYIIEIQKKYPESIQILFDAEFSFNRDWFAKLGGDLNRLLVKQTNDPTQIFDWMWGDMLEMLQDGAPINAIMIDSIRAIVYPKDVKKVSTDQIMGGSGAPYLGACFKRILPIIRQYNITTLLVQQVSQELDPMKAMRNPYVLPDGNALKFFADYMIQVDKIETSKGVIEEGTTIMGSKQQVGHKVRLKLKKNRVGAPARVAEFMLHYDKGIINIEEELFELAKSLGVVYHPTNPDTGKVNNQMWQFAEISIRGEDNMKTWVKSNPNRHQEIFDACNNVSNDKLEKRNVELCAADAEIDLGELD